MVIFTGGTIGSSLQKGYISTDKNKRYKLIEMYKNETNKEVNFTYLEPYTILSENLTGDSIKSLCEVVKNNISDKYDGIIVTHGTDTIQYSACALSYYLQEVEIPIMIVSSNYILEESKANGLINFIAAIEFIEKKVGNGVFVPYKNSDNVIYYHRGTRLLSHKQFDDNLYSIDNKYYAIYEKEHGKIKLNSNYISSNNNVIEEEIILPKASNSDILCLTPYPGFTYAKGYKDGVPKAILLNTYHSGTLCSGEDLSEFLSKAKQLNIPIFISGVKNKYSYESVKEWENENITILPFASPIAMYIKLWFYINSKELSEIIKIAVADDIIEEG